MIDCWHWLRLSHWSNDSIYLIPLNIQWIRLSIYQNQFIKNMCSDFICSPKVPEKNEECKSSIRLPLKFNRTREMNKKHTRLCFSGKPFQKFPFIFVCICFFGHSHFFCCSWLHVFAFELKTCVCVFDAFMQWSWNLMRYVAINQHIPLQLDP